MAEKLSTLRIPDMPNDDQGAYYWLMNFASALARDYEALGVARELSDTITQRAKTFQEAYEITWMPDKKTSIAIAAKNQARNDAVRAVREALKIINDNPDISESQRLMLGLKRRLDRRMRPLNRRNREAQRQADAFTTRALEGVEPKPFLVAASLQQAGLSCSPAVPKSTP